MVGMKNSIKKNIAEEQLFFPKQVLRTMSYGTRLSRSTPRRIRRKDNLCHFIVKTKLHAQNLGTRRQKSII